MPNISKYTKADNNRIDLADIIYYADKGLSVTEIARQLNCSHTNITARLKRIGYNPQRAKNYRDYKDKILEHIQSQITSRITVSDIKEASLRDKILCTGILEDKIRTIRGQATSTVEIHQITAKLEELRRKRALLDEK